MKAFALKKVLGIAIGENSLLAAELIFGPRPLVQRLGEFVYPTPLPPERLGELGDALRQFLRNGGFAAKSAVVGIPARWLLLRQKDVPPADAATLVPMLRLAAEAEFTTELGELAYDFAGDAQAADTRNVVLMATQRQRIDAIVALCRGAGLKAVAVTPSAVTLGAATGKALGRDTLVLAVGPTGSEITAQRGAVSGAVRHLGPATSQPPYSELRRAVSSMSTGITNRELFLWDGAGVDSAALGQALGRDVRNGDLPVLGVTSSLESVNGAGRRFAAAVALALSVAAGGRPAIDFLHSRLAPPRQRRVPRWTIIAVAASVLLIAAGVFAYVRVQREEADVGQLNAYLAGIKDRRDSADAFVDKVSFARAWHGGDPRYLNCIRDLTSAMPDDGETYATNLILREMPRPILPGGSTGPNGKPAPVAVRELTGILYGKTSDQRHVEALQDRIGRTSTFVDVKLGGSDDAGRGREVSFSINFIYVPDGRS